MIVSLIVAADEKGGIGLAGTTPWRLRTDMKLFKETTMGHHLIVGRKTWESIGRPLPGRKMIVVTRQLGYVAEGCDVVHGLAEGLALAEERGETQVFIGGGAEIYRLAWPLVDQIYFTRVLTEVVADTFLPQWDLSTWSVLEESIYEPSEKDEFGFKWTLFTRE